MPLYSDHPQLCYRSGDPIIMDMIRTPSLQQEAGIDRPRALINI